MVGLVSVATGGRRHLTTVVAARDSELCRVPSHLLNLLKLRYPRVVSRLISLLGQRLLMEGARSEFSTISKNNDVLISENFLASIANS